MSQDPTQQVPASNGPQSGGLFQGVNNFIGELFSPDTNYNNASPLGEQAYGKLLHDTRIQASEPIRQAQIEAGTKNLQKILPPGLNTEGNARKLAEIMNSNAAKQGFAAIKGQLINALKSMGLSEEDAVAYANAFEKNFRGLFSGFQGDYAGLFDMATAGTHDRRAIEQYGIMVGRMQTILPSAENKFARAEDYQGALAGLMREGFRPEFYVTNHDADIYRQAAQLTDEERNQIRDELRYAAIDRSNKTWADLQKDPAKLKAKIAEIKQSEWYKNHAVELKDTEPQELYRKYEQQRISADIADVMDAIWEDKTPEEIRDGMANITKTGTDDQKQMLKELHNRVGATQGQRILNEQVALQQDFRNVLAGVKDSTGFLKRLPGDDSAKMYQLIRMLGGTTFSNDYKEQVSRAINTASFAAAGDIDIERAVSMVSEAGKMTQQLGLRGDAAQVAGSLASLMTASVNNQYRGVEDMRLDQARLQATNTRNAASIIASQNSKNLTFLMTETFTGRMKELQQKLMTEGVLSPKEAAEITVENLRRDYSGTSENFEANMSDSVIDVKRDQLNSQQRLNLFRNATAMEQQKFLQYIADDGAKKAYTSVFTKDEYRGDLDTLFKTRVKLLGKVGRRRASAILAGAEPTPEEAALMDKELLDDIRKIQANVGEGFEKKEAAASAHWERYGQGRLRNPNSSLDDWGHAMTQLDDITAAQAVREEDLRKKLPTDFGLGIFEEFITSKDSAEIRGARLLKGLLGNAPSMQEDAIEMLTKDNAGVEALVTGALRGAKDAKKFIDNLTGLEGDEANEWAKTAGFESVDAMFDALKTATGDDYTKLIAQIAEKQPQLIAPILDAIKKSLPSKDKKGETPNDPEAPSSTKTSEQTNVTEETTETETSTTSGTTDNTEKNKQVAQSKSATSSPVSSIIATAVQPIKTKLDQLDFTANGAAKVFVVNQGGKPTIENAEGKQSS